MRKLKTKGVKFAKRTKSRKVTRFVVKPVKGKKAKPVKRRMPTPVIKKIIPAKISTPKREPEVKRRGEQPKHICNMKFVNTLLKNELLVGFLVKNIGRHAIDIIKSLNLPKTDDKLAGDLDIKVNEVRRVLNVMDGYGITRYDTHKNTKGWLTFNWYVDTSKLNELNEKLAAQGTENDFKLQDDCNDFFFCEKCYGAQKIILPFDTALERSFKCDCGTSLKRLSKEEAAHLFQA